MNVFKYLDFPKAIYGFGIRQFKITRLALQKFDQKHSRLQAASMTYYSTLSLVPSLTLIYGLMKGFGLENMFKEQLDHHLPTHKEIINAIFNMAQTYVTTQSGTVFAGIAIALLLWGVFKTLSTMEEAFNDIWGITEGKPLLRKLSDYLTIFLVCPLLIIFSGSITVFVSTQLEYFSHNFFYLGLLVKLTYFALLFLPFVAIWLMFSFLYIFMPNTQVNLKSAFWGALIAGTLFQITQWGYFAFQVWFARSNAIYGSLAAIPLFLVWLQLSWMIILFGAEITFARQYLKTYNFEFEHITASTSLRKRIALLVMYLCIKDFEQGKTARTVGQISEHLHLPASLTQEVISELVEANLLSKIYCEDTHLDSYQPARTINTIHTDDVLHAIEHRGQDEIPLSDSPELHIINKHIAKLELHSHKESVLVKDL